jgi:hypothetical protein
VKFVDRTKERDRRTKSAVAHDLAQKIDAHLKRFERDPKINPGKRLDKETKTWVPDPMGVRDYYNARASGDRHRVRVVYVSYQGASHLSVEDAQKYLAWLAAGNIGTHYRALREVTK